MRFKGSLLSRVRNFRGTIGLLLSTLRPARRRQLAGAACAVFAIIVGGLAGLGWSMTGPKVYTATGISFVKLNFPPTVMDPFSAREFVSGRIDSYAQLATAANVLVAVQVDVPGYTLEQLQGKIQVFSPPGTVLLESTATDTNPRNAARLADSVLTQLGAIVSGAEGGGGASGGSSASPISIQQIQPATLPVTPTTEINTTKVAIGAGAGAAVGGLLWWWIVRRRATRNAGGDTDSPLPGVVAHPGGSHRSSDEVTIE